MTELIEINITKRKYQFSGLYVLKVLKISRHGLVNPLLLSTELPTQRLPW